MIRLALGTWEGVGQFTGVWLGAAMALATMPVVVVDGPLPIADTVWLYANVRNTNNLRRRGGIVGAQIDDLIADDPVVEAFVRIPPEFDVKTPTDNPAEFVFNNLPGGSGIDMSMGSFLDFSNLMPTTFDMTYYSPEQAKIMTLEIAPQFYMFPTTFRESKWPAWN